MQQQNQSFFLKIIEEDLDLFFEDPKEIGGPNHRAFHIDRKNISKIRFFYNFIVYS